MIPIFVLYLLMALCIVVEYLASVSYTHLNYSTQLQTIQHSYKLFYTVTNYSTQLQAILYSYKLFYIVTSYST
ncbi:hypothetical protein TRFO_40164 [Tritrichomonas foetus]|uniref:Secreted protein n=1 Tax=Tritrichomonas foetus TaxID=1144522 RepID=A0A1J4J5Z5_9EUKA|nr:hypothetical protein TRFO_40164 [Tritrichomonas foetus]|eukprot:OHS93575.1 hypothetical protein TRFO_40164 [Tritrichomonas foetus]